jgi:hypothetical protein
MAISITISAKVARPKKDCKSGFGLCDITIEIEFGIRARLIVDEENQTASLEFLTLPPGSSCGEEGFYVDRNVVLPQKAANCLGYSNVNILRGVYAYDTCKSQFGTVTGMQVELLNRLEEK